MGKKTNNIYDVIIDKNRKVILLITLLLIGTPFLIIFGIKNIIRKDTLVGIADLAVSGVILCTLFQLIFKRNRYTVRFSSYVVLLFFGVLVLINIASGGDAGAQALWTYIFPLGAFFLLGQKGGAVCMAFFFLILAPLLYGCFPLAVAEYSNEYKIRFLLSLFVVTAMTMSFEVIRQYSQEKLMASNQKLREAENRTREAYDKLKTIKSQHIQSAKLASIGQLAASVAHEINHPLQVIQSIGEMLRVDLKKDKLDPGDIQKKVEILNRNSNRMLNIVKHLHTFSRKSNLAFFPLDINQIIEHSFIMLEHQLEQKGITVIKDLARDLPRVWVDSNQLEQVFINLFTNAKDAIEERRDSGGIINIYTQLDDQDGNYVNVYIKDNGAGINTNYISNIFDPFFSTKKDKGTGLGLSISYDIIKDHNGEIEVIETSEQGTVFRIKIPVGIQKAEAISG